MVNELELYSFFSWIIIDNILQNQTLDFYSELLTTN